MHNKGLSKYSKLDEVFIKEIEKGNSHVSIAKKYFVECGGTVGGLRDYLKRQSYINDTFKSKYYNPPTKHDALEKECETVGLPTDAVGNYWYKGKHFSIHVKNKQITYDQIREELIEDMKAYAPKYPKIERIKYDDPHLLVLDPCDIHIGKLASSFETGEEYNSNIAVSRVKEGVLGILNKVQGFSIERILFIGGNDILHIDDAKRKSTTGGTIQDTDGMWYDNFQLGKKLMVEIIEMLTTLADVHLLFCPSNHDFMSGFFLCDSVSSWFSKAENITFDIDMRHRKYYSYGQNIIGATHGDGAKPADLPLLMAQETGQNWLCKHRYIYGHHLHHKISKDFGSVNFEVMRTSSGTDGWHSRNGYQHAPKAIEGFLHHPENGQIARITHLF